MKILTVADGFLPGKKYGGPPISVDNFCTLMDGVQCYVVARNHDLRDQTPYTGISEGWNDRGNCMVRYLPDSEFNMETFESVIQQLHPDWIYLQSLFQRCVMPCLHLAKKYGIRVMLAPRGELCKGAMRKKYKKIPYIMALHLLGLLKGVTFQSTSQEESEAVGRYLRAKEEDICFLTNVPSVPAVPYPAREKRSGSAKLVFLSRIHPKKNLLSAIGYLKNVTGQMTFDIYGPLEDEAYWNECRRAIELLPDNIRVRYCGLVGHEDVHRVFSQYDAFLFPTLSENYGHAIVEALMVGCPVITSDQTPWLDLHEHGAGWAIPLDREQAFRDAVEQVVAWDAVPEDKVKAYVFGKLNLHGLREMYRAAFGA
jgi:glycosyltransferase involved in cell wall biosynthesis